MKQREHLGRWRSEKAEQRFRAVEDAAFREFTRQPEPIDVETSVGTTRVYHWPGDGDPVVLLHGMGGSSIMWSEFAEALGSHAVYAVDTMGDAGRSVQRVAFRDVAHLAQWLDETIVGLGLERSHLVGNSYGGWMALDLAVHLPGRALSISLLDPAGLAKISTRFFTWGLKLLVAGMMPGPIRRAAARRLGFPYLARKGFLRAVVGVQMNHPFRLPIEVLTDEQLRAIGVPVLLLVGEKSAIYRAREVVARAEATLPHVDAEIIPGVGHALPIDPKADAPRRVVSFLERVTTA